jgi:succinate-acetate transporter protein
MDTAVDTRGRGRIAEVNGSTAARIYLQPIAAPSILGLYGLCGASFIFAAFMARWFGNATTPAFLVPFAASFGGLAQLLAAMWAYKARDGVATAMHGMWGSFWIAYGLLYTLLLAGKVSMPTGTDQALGFWFIVLSVITATGTFAALAEGWGMAGVWGLLTLGSICFALANLLNSAGLVALAGWLFFLTSLAAWYAASALMFEDAFGRSILPFGRARRARQQPALDVGTGEPGVVHGQYAHAG